MDKSQIMKMENRLRLLTDRDEVANARLIKKLERRLRAIKKSEEENN